MTSWKISQTIRLTIATFGLLVAASGTALAQNVPPPPALRARKFLRVGCLRNDARCDFAFAICSLPL